MAVLHKKRNANTKKRARLMLGMAACVFAPTALAVWYLTALLAKRQPPAALAYGALAAAAAGALCFRVLYTRSAVLKSGIDGERQAAAALRALPYLKKGGTLITDEREIYPMPVLSGEQSYPHDAIETLKQRVDNVIVIRAAETAEKLGSIKAQNIVLLGALVKAMGLDGVDWKALVSAMVPPKAVEMNLAAYDAGYNME